MGVARREYFLQLVDTRTKKPIDDDAGVFQVYTAGAPTRPSIYSLAGAALTVEKLVTGRAFKSQTMTNGQIHFFTNVSVSSLDLSVQTNGGRAYFLKGVSPSQHRVDVDPEETEYKLVVAVNDKGSVTTVTPLGFKIKKGMLLKDLIIHLVTKFSGATTASNTIDFGYSGVPDAFYNGILLQQTATTIPIKLLTNNPQVVASSTGVLLSTKIGVALGNFSTGTAVTQVGFFYRKSFATGVTSKNLVMQAKGAQDATVTTNTGKAYVYYIYDLLPTAQSTT